MKDGDALRKLDWSQNSHHGNPSSDPENKDKPDELD